MATRIIETSQYSPQERAYAIGYDVSGNRGRFHIRRVVWGRLLARAEKREGEKIRRCSVLITGKQRFMAGLVYTRPDDAGAFDELIADHIDVHMEMMNDKTLWIGIRRAGFKDEVHVTVTANSNLSVNVNEA